MPVLGRVLGRDTAARKIDEGLERTRRGWLSRLAGVFGPVDITEQTWEDLEVQLIQSDVGVATALAIVSELREEARDIGVRRADELPEVLRDVLVELVSLPAGSGDGGAGAGEPAPRPWVTLVVGVNGSGKTTTIAKLAHAHKAAGSDVLLVPADTFRAAAIEQLTMWGERIGVRVAAARDGADPGAVVFDALGSNAGRKADVVIVDTAGRLHTHANLMAELEKVRGVMARATDGAPHETLLVLDATTGQNGLAQANAFADTVGVSGIVLAKLDSSAKGGAALSVTREMGLPIHYVGTGEGVADLAPFDAAEYVDGLLGREPDG